MRLSDRQLDALQNLSRKKGGAVVGWIGIAEARGLTTLGFATRSQSGWQITPAGEAILGQLTPTQQVDADVIALQPRPKPRTP